MPHLVAALTYHFDVLKLVFVGWLLVFRRSHVRHITPIVRSILASRCRRAVIDKSIHAVPSNDLGQVIDSRSIRRVPPKIHCPSCMAMPCKGSSNGCDKACSRVGPHGEVFLAHETI